jgi:hypothetical protein
LPTRRRMAEGLAQLAAAVETMSAPPPTLFD